jgi:LysW-gamma-L-lysine/LysW-L-ornithine aminotransferase
MSAAIISGEMMALEDRYDAGLYAKQPLVLVRGEGARVWDADGKEYVDCAGGQGVANVGHAHPAIAAAVAAQAGRLLTCPNGFYNEVRARLLARLVGMAPPGIERAYLCNSGTEAVEAAFKFARLATGRAGVVAAMRGFHGRTMGALSATWNKAYREPFEPLLPGFSFVPYNRLDAAERAIGPDTAAVILEVVQGEGGVIPGQGEYLRGVQALCRERGALFIVDEVQTGLGRTGRMFACEHHDLEPDLLCLAKALAGGLPVGAVLISRRVGELPRKAHGSTFGGNPLVCAAALATIDCLQAEDLPRRAAELGARFKAGLEGIDSPLVREVRGLGLMIGLELKTPAGPYLAALAERGVLALTAGATVMRFLPPLVIQPEQVEFVLSHVSHLLTRPESPTLDSRIARRPTP